MKSPTLNDGLQRLREFSAADEARVARLNAFRAEILTLLAEEDATVDRYGSAADVSEAELCCPVDYDATALSHIPEEILAIDYGCGDPTVFAEAGQTVLDLGSGSGKHCFMIAKTVGPEGRVIGIDKTPQMLDKSRAAIPQVMANLSYADSNVEFRCGHIENLRIDRERLLELIKTEPFETYDDLESLEAKLATPLVADESVDLVVSNCVLNLVGDERKRQLFREIFRVVKKGGGVAISDIVADRPIPEDMKSDDHLWTGCLSGAFQRQEFHEVFARAGFHGMREAKSSFWKSVGGINFFSVTILAQKGKQGPCYETYRQALYVGPFSEIRDDDNHLYQRGLWTPVCEKTAGLLEKKPYAGHFLVTPALEDPAKKIPFDCGSGSSADRELPAAIAAQLQSMTEAGDCCTDEGCC